jgi:hypothetical protein
MNMLKNKILFFMLAISSLLLPPRAQAQTNTMEGKISDNDTQNEVVDSDSMTRRQAQQESNKATLKKAKERVQNKMNNQGKMQTTDRNP